MLKVSELLATLKEAPKDAVVYLPGGCPVRVVDTVEAEGVYLRGDEEAVGTHAERTAADEIKAAIASELGLDAHSDKVAALAWKLVAAGARELSSQPAPSAVEGSVVLTPGAGDWNAAGADAQVK